jgi:hypothetical protein
MRAQTLRSAVGFGLMMAAFGGVVLAPASAEAATGTAGPNSSVGSAALRYEQLTGIPTSIETGFKGPSFAKINVGIGIDPVANGGPLYVIDMPRGAQVVANWGADKKILLKPQDGAPTDGLVNVRHTLTPFVKFKFSGFGLNADYTYNGTDLVNKIPGASFFFDSKASQPFAPWGFAGVATKLNAPDVANSTLFSMNMNVLPDFVSKNVTGSFGVRATTKPTFTYKTTKIMLAGQAGAITATGTEMSIDAIDGDYLELMTAVEGEMTVAGDLSIQPFVRIDTILDEFNLDADFGIDVLSFPYTVPAQKVNFQTVLLHIPMPNVKAPTRGVDLGEVKVGKEKSKTVVIENTGEKEATMSFKSSDAQFTVPGETVTVPPKGKYELKVKFSADSASAASADITVSSNDADSPEQSFKIGANGADVGADPDDDDDGLGGSSSDAGCGCKTAGSASMPGGGWAAFGLAGLGVVVLASRRKKS